MTRPPMPCDQAELFRRMQDGGDDVAREELISRGMSIVHFIARRYRERGFSAEELTQVGSVGLINAVDRFAPDRGVRFTTFAVPYVSGEIRRHFRDHGWSVRVARRVQENIAAVNRATDALAVELQRRPTLPELVEATGLEREDVLEAVDARRQYRAQSLDAPLTSADDEGVTVLDGVGTIDRGFGRAEDRVAVLTAMRGLQPRERRILLLRYTEDLKQQEIGERLGLSQMHVSRLLAQALDRLAEILGSTEEAPARLQPAAG